GIELVGSCSIEAYDAAAPQAVRSAAMLPGARGVVLAGSAGTALWTAYRAFVAADPAHEDRPHPYDAFVARLLARADAALGAAGCRLRRFDAAFHATPRIDFVALARLCGLGTPGPFFLAIHATHGPWWAMRGAWLLDAEVDPQSPHVPPCDGCLAPCVGGWQNAGGIAVATPRARARCVVGQGSRYDDEQIAFHYGTGRAPGAGA
ncbi:MAG: hypothetical protein ACRELB_19445, partial [Polyangiaceae bacterium]